MAIKLNFLEKWAIRQILGALRGDIALKAAADGDLTLFSQMFFQWASEKVTSKNPPKPQF
jgi:hypothetical protein